MIKYQQEINDLGISEYVTLDDRYIPNEEIPILFSAADLFVAPYVDGTQSGAIKLALAYNMPIVSTSIISDNKIESGTYWRIVPPFDSMELSRALLEFRPIESLIMSKGFSWKDLADYCNQI